MNRRTDNERRESDVPETQEAEGVFRRWSRRKHEARVAETRSEKARDPAPPAVADQDPSADAPDRVLTDADMPPVESLDENSDFSPFMSPGVSDTLRQAALRKLFRAPRLNQLCELEGEYFDARGYRPLGDVVTYDMRAALEREAEKLKTQVTQVKEKLQREITSAEAPAPDTEPAAAASATGESGAETQARTESDPHAPGERGEA